MATHSSILPWEIPWTEGPGRHSPWGLKSRIWLNDSTTTTSTLLAILSPISRKEKLSFPEVGMAWEKYIKCLRRSDSVELETLQTAPKDHLWGSRQWFMGLNNDIITLCKIVKSHWNILSSSSSSSSCLKLNMKVDIRYSQPIRYQPIGMSGSIALNFCCSCLIIEFKYFVKEQSYLIYGYKLVTPVS